MSMFSTRAALACEYSAAPEPRPEMTDSGAGRRCGDDKVTEFGGNFHHRRGALRVFDVSPVMMMAPDSIWLFTCMTAAAYCVDEGHQLRDVHRDRSSAA